jgi:excisionase family DNA binding protein
MTGLVSVATLAGEDYLDCSRDTVYRMARAGEIPHIRIGREYRFDPDAVKQKLTATPRPWTQSKRSVARKRAA